MLKKNDTPAPSNLLHAAKAQATQPFRRYACYALCPNQTKWIQTEAHFTVSEFARMKLGVAAYCPYCKSGHSFAPSELRLRQPD